MKTYVVVEWDTDNSSEYMMDKFADALANAGIAGRISHWCEREPVFVTNNGDSGYMFEMVKPSNRLIVNRLT